MQKSEKVNDELLSWNDLNRMISVIHEQKKIINGQIKNLTDQLNSFNKEEEIYSRLISQIKKPDNIEEIGPRLVLDKENTLKILTNLDRSSGVSIQEITKNYKDNGIKCHDRYVQLHLKELMDEGKVIRTNPGIKRGRLFALPTKEMK